MPVNLCIVLCNSPLSGSAMFKSCNRKIQRGIDYQVYAHVFETELLSFLANFGQYLRLPDMAETVKRHI